MPAAPGWTLPRLRGLDHRPSWMERPTPAQQAAKAVLLVVLGLVMLFPFVYVVAVSFSSYEDVVGGGIVLFPTNPTLEAYRTVFAGGVVTDALRVSILLTVVGTAVNMVMTVSLAYALSRTSVAGSRFVLAVVLLTFLFQPGLIPRFLVVKELGLLDSLASLVLPGMISAFNLVVVRNFFMNIPADLIDGARIDGADDLRLLWDIVLPLSKAVLAVIALFYGVALWNIFFDAILYIRDTDKWPIQVILRQFVIEGQPMAQRPTNLSRPAAPPETIRMAVLVIATVPILLVYPFLQRYFTRGVLSGAIKG
jgi:putative aldouronate transport system permease protein